MRNLLILIFIIVLAGCSMGPGNKQVAEDIKSLFPDAKISKIEVIETEVVAIIFRAKYQLGDSKKDKEIILQYIEYENGWALSNIKVHGKKWSRVQEKKTH